MSNLLKGDSMKLEVKHINKCASESGWQLLDHQKNIYMISFFKFMSDYRARINIYYSKSTVSTCIDHPKKGKTQLFRKNVTPALLKKIFNNPRIHTGSGYYCN